MTVMELAAGTALLERREPAFARYIDRRSATAAPVAPRPPEWRVVRDYDGPTPDEGPLELYRRHFPDRELRWDPRRELWTVWQVASDLERSYGYGPRGYRIALLHQPHIPEASLPFDIPLEIRGRMGRWMALHGSSRVEKVFRPFDYRYVEKVIRDDWTQRTLGNREHGKKMRERNRAKVEARDREKNQLAADMLADIRRWLPTLPPRFFTMFPLLLPELRAYITHPGDQPGEKPALGVGSTFN